MGKQTVDLAPERGRRIAYALLTDGPDSGDIPEAMKDLTDMEVARIANAFTEGHKLVWAELMRRSGAPPRKD